MLREVAGSETAALSSNNQSDILNKRKPQVISQIKDRRSFETVSPSFSEVLPKQRTEISTIITVFRFPQQSYLFSFLSRSSTYLKTARDR